MFKIITETSAAKTQCLSDSVVLKILLYEKIMGIVNIISQNNRIIFYQNRKSESIKMRFSQKLMTENTQFSLILKVS